MNTHITANTTNTAESIVLFPLERYSTGKFLLPKGPFKQVTKKHTIQWYAYRGALFLGPESVVCF